MSIKPRCVAEVVQLNFGDDVTRRIVYEDGQVEVQYRSVWERLRGLLTCLQHTPG